MKNKTNFEKHLQEELKDPEFKKAYEEERQKLPWPDLEKKGGGGGGHDCKSRCIVCSPKHAGEVREYLPKKGSWEERYKKELKQKLIAIRNGALITPILFEIIAEHKQAREEVFRNIGHLRQWLNEDRITDPKKMVTNEELRHWLDLKVIKKNEVGV